MTNCTNENLRDLLPDLAHDVLTAEQRVAVEAHVASCADCAAELEIIRRAATLFTAATPRVDTAAIVAKLPTVPAQSPRFTVVTPLRTRSRVPQRMLALAASLLLMVTVSSPVWGPRFWGDSPSVDVVVDSAPSAGAVVATAETTTVPAAVPSAAATSSIVAGTDLRALNEDELSSLLDQLDAIEATVAAEPVTVASPIITAPEGM